MEGKISFVKNGRVFQGYIPQGIYFSWDKFIELLMGLGILSK
jgi:hypothetical protein